MTRSPVVFSGFVLSLVGGALDLLSAYNIGSSDMMDNSHLLTAVGLVVLAAAIVATGVAIVLPSLKGKMRLTGALMEAYGVVMGLVSNYAPSMNPTVGDAMLGVGILMFVNGLIMQSQSRNSKM